MDNKSIETIHIQDKLARYKEICGEQQLEIEHLKKQLTRIAIDIELWQVLGSHKTCTCKACEDLQEMEI